MKSIKLFFILISALLVALGGCRHKLNDESNTNSTSDSGELAIALTDAKGDFVTYEVNVVKLNLTKTNGAVVETLPESTTVDFAQYTDLTEFFTAATIPSGTYTHATVTLDYTGSNITVEGEDGIAKQVSKIVDTDGNDITTVELSVRLDGRNKLTIVPGVPAMLTLDFDLAASNKVEFVDATTTKITVEPFLVASLDVDADKLLRARGLLKNVDATNSQFDLVVRPFHHLLRNNGSRFGVRTIAVNDSTQYEIDGTTYTGSEGLAKLATMSDLSSVVVKGTVNIAEKKFLAQQVLGGTSVAGNESDVVTGNVVKRVGNIVTLRGATLERAQSTATFHDTITIELSDTTRVKRQFDQATNVTINDISIGQRLVAFGSFSATAKSIAATAIRLLPTAVSGTVRQITNDTVVLKVQDIDRRSVKIFDFAGSGASATEFEILATNLVNSVAAGDVIRVVGYTSPFTNSTPDFYAKTLVKINDVTAQMLIGWPLGTSTPFSSTASDSFQLKLPSAGLVHHVVRGGITTDLITVGSDPIVKANPGVVPMLVKQGHVVTLHTSLDNLIADINSRVSNGGKLRSFRAVGAYDNTANTITSKRIDMLIQ